MEFVIGFILGVASHYAWCKYGNGCDCSDGCDCNGIWNKKK